MFADYHVHSHFSEDTDFPMELEIQKAIKLGMDELCFTEHSDYDVPTVVNCDYDAYFEEMEKMKDKYKGQITLKTGIEFGIQTHTTKAYEETFRQKHLVRWAKRLGCLLIKNYLFCSYRVLQEVQRICF